MAEEYHDEVVSFQRPENCTEIVRFNKATWHLSCGSLQISLSLLPQDSGELVVDLMGGQPPVPGYRVTEPERFSLGGNRGVFIDSTREESGDFLGKQIQALIEGQDTYLMVIISDSEDFSFEDYADFLESITFSPDALGVE